MSNTDKRGFTPVEAARYLGVSKSYLDHARASGDGPAYVRLGGRIRYLREDLDAWLDALPRYAHAAAEAARVLK